MIVFVINNLDVGGCERHLATIIPHIHQWRPVRVLIMDTVPGFFSSSLTQKGVDVRCLLKSPFWKQSFPGKPFLIKIAKLWALTKEFNKLSSHDPIIHCFLPGAYMLGAAASRIAGVKTLIMSRRSLNHYQSWPWKKVERFCHRWLTKAVGNSRLVIEQLKDEGIPQERLTLLYNGVETPAFHQPHLRQETRKALKLSHDEVVIIHLANLIPYKGHQDLIEAVASLDPNLKIRVLCVGSDRGIQKALEKHALSLGVYSRFSFLGARQDVPALLACADISVLPSHEEGFPNAILESMAAGLPVIATAIGGSQEAVVHEKTGLLVPPHAPLELAQALKRLIMSTELRRQYGETGYQRVQDEFSLTSCVQGYHNLYEELRPIVKGNAGNPS